MDTLKILLGATVALLVGALAVSLKGLRQGMASVPAEEMAQMKRELAEMQAEIDRIKQLRLEKELEKAMSESKGPSRSEMEEQVREAEERARVAEAKAEEAMDDAQMAEDEALEMNRRDLESRNKMARRARVISDAMLIAVIKEWIEDPNAGQFAILDVRSQENVQPGTVLALRRNGGVLGRLKVSDVTIDGAVANPTTMFTEVKPEAGDELILDEVVKLAN